MSKQVSLTFVPNNIEPIRNVHEYDGKLEYKLNIPVYPEEKKHELFNRIKQNLSNESQRMIECIQTSGRGNYDHINGYDASDLLYHLLITGKGDDLYINLNEQLSDAYRLGKCPQGRTIRLLSLIGAFC